MTKYIVLTAVLLLTGCDAVTRARAVQTECQKKGGVLLYMHASQGVFCFKRDVFINVKVVE